jgi:hypothetical protein
MPIHDLKRSRAAKAPSRSIQRLWSKAREDKNERRRLRIRVAEGTARKLKGGKRGRPGWRRLGLNSHAEFAASIGVRERESYYLRAIGKLVKQGLVKWGDVDRIGVAVLGDAATVIRHLQRGQRRRFLEVLQDLPQAEARALTRRLRRVADQDAVDAILDGCRP